MEVLFKIVFIFLLFTADTVIDRQSQLDFNQTDLSTNNEADTNEGSTTNVMPTPPELTYQLLDANISDIKQCGNDTESPSMLYKFDKDEHVGQLLNNIRCLWNDQDMIDVRIASEDKQIFKFHGVVLAGYSPKIFKSILTNGNMHWFQGILAPRNVKTEQLENLQNCLYKPDLFTKTMSKSEPSVMTDFSTFFGLEEMAVNAFIDCPRLLTNWYDMYNQRCLTFAVAKNGDEEIPVHAPILAACSPVFKEQYVNDPDDPLCMLYNVYHVDGYAIDQLLEYVYTAQLELDENTVEAIFKSACSLRMISAAKACCKFIHSTLKPDKCLYARCLANRCYDIAHDEFIKELYVDIEKYIVENFLEIIETDSFIQMMSEEDIVMYLSRADVHEVEAAVIINAVLRWYGSDAAGRVEALARILGMVSLLMDRTGMIKATALAYKQDREKHDVMGQIAACMAMHAQGLQHRDVQVNQQ